MIYLDYSAHTPADEEVLSVFCETERRFIGNANSVHEAGNAARAEMARITDSIASALSVLPSEIIYTSGASEANNTAIRGIARAQRHIGKHILASALDHPSASTALTHLQERGYEIDLVGITREGKVDLDALSELLRKDTILVVLTAVDSELGTVQPVSAVRDLLKNYPDCRLHVDATQAVGKIPFSFAEADTACFAPHKFYGLCGTGILVKKEKIPMEPLIYGGAGTTLYRSGTPTVGLAASTEKALLKAGENLSENLSHVTKLNETLREFFKNYPLVRINSPADAVPHIINVSVAGVRGVKFREKLNECGVCVSVKSACSSDGLPSRAVMAVSGDRKNALSSFRISLGAVTTEEEILQFQTIFDQCYRELTT